MARTEPPPVAQDLRSTAFGIELSCPMDLVGLPASAAESTDLPTVVEVDTSNPLDADLSAEGEEVRVVKDLEGRITLSVRHHPRRGYLLTLPEIASFRVRLDGLRVTCLPDPEAPPWRWQRALVNQVLPLTATLHGFEVFHAGAVSLEGHVIAMVGHPGAGKSSTTLNLVLEGAGFFTDDALAVRCEGDDVLAYPGAAVSNFPRAERELMGPGEPERLGETIAEEGGFRSLLAIAREADPLPLGAMYFLRRGQKEVSEIRFERHSDPDPVKLLGSTYVYSVQSPERLSNQLEVCAAIANGVPVFDLLIPNTVPARESANALIAHATSLLAGQRP
jgi:hypothetical protein